LDNLIFSLVKKNYIKYAINLIREVIKKSNFSDVELNMLKIIQSILYYKNNDHYRSFVVFIRHFKNYYKFRLPKVLSNIYVPLYYKDIVFKYSKEYGVDPYLVFSIIKQESSFIPDAVSPSKAYGLMQLLLPTARAVAYTEGIKVFRKDLFKPDLNIKLGVKYLKYLFNKLKDVHHVLAAYNAGDSRVIRWKKEKEGMEKDEFIDTIPFTQTRNYVKKILRNYYYYKLYYEN